MILISIVVRAFLAVLFHDQGEALARTASEPVEVDEAAIHFAASRAAAAIYQVDSDELLAVAGRESNYRDTRELVDVDRGHVEGAGPRERPSVLHGYLRVASHLREWFDASDRQFHRQLTHNEALVGVAGGYVLIEACRVGPMIMHLKHGDFDVCLSGSAITWKRDQIRRARQVGGRS